MTSAIDENVIRATTETLGKVIKKVPLTEKLLSRPPFKFIHDIIKEIIRNNGFLTGLYTDDELSSENIKNKEAKIQFLQKAIDVLGFITNKPLNQIKATKIVAGLEPEQTNELLQLLGKCVIARKESSLAVKKVLRGEKPSNTNLNLSVSQELLKQNPKSVRKNSFSPKTNATKSPKQSPKSSGATKLSSSISPVYSASSPKKLDDSESKNQSKKNFAVRKISTNSVSSTKKSTISSSKSNSTIKSDNQQTKVIPSKPNAIKTNQQATTRRGQEKSKPATNPTSKKVTAANKLTSSANQTNEKNLSKNRTLTKDELDIIRATKWNDRADDEKNEKNSEKNLDSSNAEENNEELSHETGTKEVNQRTASDLALSTQPVSLEESNQNVISKSITDHGLDKTQNKEMKEEENENAGHAEHRHYSESNNDEVSTDKQMQSAVSKSAKLIDRQPNSSAFRNNNVILRSSATRPIVEKQIDKSDESKKLKQRPTTASRPLTARAAPPRAVSRRVLREETKNEIEMINLVRPQTAVKQVLVTNLIKESNDLLDEDEDSATDDLNKRTLTANREHALLKEQISELDEQNDLLLNKTQSIDTDELEDGEKGSLVKKLMKSKQELEGDIEQARISTAKIVRSNRDIERLKEHIQTLTKLANPLSKLLDYLQEDIDLMLLEERNWLEEQQRNEQQLLVLREQMDEELKNLNLQIANLDDQIHQEKDTILVTNVNLLINQAKLEEIVRRMIEN